MERQRIESSTSSAQGPARDPTDAARTTVSRSVPTTSSISSDVSSRSPLSGSERKQGRPSTEINGSYSVGVGSRPGDDHGADPIMITIQAQSVESVEEGEPDAAVPQRLVEGGEHDVTHSRLHPPEDRALVVEEELAGQEQPQPGTEPRPARDRRRRRRRRGRTCRAPGPNPGCRAVPRGRRSQSRKSSSSMAPNPRGSTSSRHGRCPGSRSRRGRRGRRVGADSGRRARSRPPGRPASGPAARRRRRGRPRERPRRAAGSLPPQRPRRRTAPAAADHRSRRSGPTAPCSVGRRPPPGRRARGPTQHHGRRYLGRGCRPLVGRPHLQQRRGEVGQQPHTPPQELGHRRRPAG